ncbi:hypothetical protein [Leptospira jelokensis]|uniref:hypothetical protein n=1 Tax=Leptospira jelokensis TaxID=2484931 RepID=UPI00109180BC|nr:hypothetical protein [Leptospira jelokensis]TGL97886.1 hypothetical protein EHQ79_19140 [Leptospira jelokensis]
MNKKTLQIISHEKLISYQSETVIASSFESPESLDMFLINIIDLRSTYLWRFQGEKPVTIDSMADLMHLNTMIKNSSDTILIYLYPRDSVFVYNSRSGRYINQIRLKDMLYSLENDILTKALNLPYTKLTFEKTETKVSNHNIKAEFYFNTDKNILTKSVISNKPTTISHGKHILTTLSFDTIDEILAFINSLNLLDNKEELPEWIPSFNFNNDHELYKEININLETIKNVSEKIKKAEDQLKVNIFYKSILFESGNNLIKPVFSILEKMLKCNLKEFVDKKKEDFLIQLDSVNFIGEIKGVSNNVKSSYISQLDLHYQNFIENNSNQKLNKPILIICHQRHKNPYERENIHLDQIELAKRNGSLIIETITLLKIFDFYLSNKINSEQILELFKERIGLLTLE